MTSGIFRCGAFDREDGGAIQADIPSLFRFPTKTKGKYGGGASNCDKTVKIAASYLVFVSVTF